MLVARHRDAIHKRSTKRGAVRCQDALRRYDPPLGITIKGFKPGIESLARRDFPLHAPQYNAQLIITQTLLREWWRLSVRRSTRDKTSMIATIACGRHARPEQSHAWERDGYTSD